MIYDTGNMMKNCADNCVIVNNILKHSIILVIWYVHYKGKTVRRWENCKINSREIFM